VAAAADPKYPQHKTKSLINYLNFNERNGEKVRSLVLLVAAVDGVHSLIIRS
jgi:hypothetical protein